MADSTDLYVSRNVRDKVLSRSNFLDIALYIDLFFLAEKIMAFATEIYWNEIA